MFTRSFNQYITRLKSLFCRRPCWNWFWYVNACFSWSPFELIYIGKVCLEMLPRSLATVIRWLKNAKIYLNVHWKGFSTEFVFWVEPKLINNKEHLFDPSRNFILAKQILFKNFLSYFPHVCSFCHHLFGLLWYLVVSFLFVGADCR